MLWFRNCIFLQNRFRAEHFHWGKPIILPHTFGRITRAYCGIKYCNVKCRRRQSCHSCQQKIQKKINTLPHAAAIQLLRAERDNIFNYMPHRQPKTATGIQISSTTTKLENNLRILHAPPNSTLCVCFNVFFVFLGVFIKEIHTAVEGRGNGDSGVEF